MGRLQLFASASFLILRVVEVKSASEVVFHIDCTSVLSFNS
jgi:hypothetical protein